MKGQFYPPKFLIAALSFTFTLSLCKAQYISAYKPIYKTVSQDTINIKGKLLDAFGVPVRGFEVMSQNKEYVYDGYYNYALTDSAGNFTLNGALLNDTLSVDWDKRTVKVSANGSRYIEIHLPLRTPDTAYRIPIAISAIRTKKQKKPVFKVITNAPINDYYGVFPNIYIAARAAGTTFRDYVSSKVAYPEKAIENNIEGEVQISFVVERDGRLTSFHVIRGIGYGCEDAVINVLKACHNWRPAVAAGRPVTSSSFVIIDFKLTDR